MPLVFGSDLTGTAALAVLTRVLASFRTASSAYLAGAATGKWPSTSPVSAPITDFGIPPISWARSSTDWTYQPAWLYAKIACERFEDAPAAWR